MSRDNDGMTTMKINEALKMRYRQQGYWGDATLADYWHLSAKASADKIAVSDNHGTAYTYRELDNAAGALAMWLVKTVSSRVIGSPCNFPAGVSLPLSILPVSNAAPSSCRCFRHFGSLNWHGS
jgi:hypothetical protein